MNETIIVILNDFAEWIKTQPVYIGGKTGDKEVLVLRDGELKSAVEVYLDENKALERPQVEYPKADSHKAYWDNVGRGCDFDMDEDAKEASIPYTYNAPQHDWKCGYPDITKAQYYNKRGKDDD